MIWRDGTYSRIAVDMIEELLEWLNHDFIKIILNVLAEK